MRRHLPLIVALLCGACGDAPTSRSTSHGPRPFSRHPVPPLCVERGRNGLADKIAFEDPRLEEFAASLTKDTSALVLVGEKVTLADFTSAVQPFGGKVIETDLDDKDVKSLRDALRRAA